MSRSSLGPSSTGGSSRSSLTPSPAVASKDNIQVCVRVRPGVVGSDEDATSLHGWQSSRTTLTDVGGHSGGSSTFEFDQVYRPTDSTQDVYQKSIEPIVTQFTAGFNATVLAYGQTASGKTHTMSGLLDLSIDQLFALVGRDSSRVYLLRCSFLEVYSEAVNDLLSPNARTSRAADVRSGKGLAVRESGGGFKVASLTETIVTTASEVRACIELGTRNRKVGVSNLNEHSSRSHSIFRITLESAERADAKTPAAKTNSRNSTGGVKLAGAVKVSELNFVDLAGSETLSYDHGSTQQSETKSINLSLTNLKTVIVALSKGESHVPFRNSVLTKILRTSLGGNARTCLVCAMNPLPVHARASRGTLQFGQTASRITNSACVNEVAGDEGDAHLLRQQQQKIAKLEDRLAGLAQLEEEKERIQREYAQLQAHVEDLRRKEAEQADLRRQVTEASRMVVGGPTIQVALAPISVSTVSEEELAALSSQLSTLQSQKSDLERAKSALESQLQKQLSLQATTEAEIASRRADLEAAAVQAEQDRAELIAQTQLVASRQVERDALAAQLVQAREVAAQQEREAREQVRLVEEQRRQSDALQARLNTQAEEMRAKEASMQLRVTEQQAAAAALQRQIDAQATAMREKEAALQARVAQQQSASAALQAQVDAQSSAVREKSAALARLESEQRAASEQLAAQMRALEGARASQADQEAAMRRMQLDQSRKEADHRQRMADMEKAAAGMQALNTAAQRRWAEHIKLQNVSGIDKDSYLANIMETYETDLHKLRRSLEESESALLAQQLESEDTVRDLKRRLAAAQASADKTPALAAQPQRPPPFRQPGAGAAGAGDATPLSSLPLLVVPGEIDLAMSDALLNEGDLSAALPPCALCASPDRADCDRLRSLCNHARRTLADAFQRADRLAKEVDEVRNEVQGYKMQVEEYEARRRN